MAELLWEAGHHSETNSFASRPMGKSWRCQLSMSGSLSCQDTGAIDKPKASWKPVVDIIIYRFEMIQLTQVFCSRPIVLNQWVGGIIHPTGARHWRIKISRTYLFTVSLELDKEVYSTKTCFVSLGFWGGFAIIAAHTVGPMLTQKNLIIVPLK